MSGLTWAKGGEGTVLALQGELWTVRASRAFAPGEPAAGTVRTEQGGLPFVLKVSGCKREPSEALSYLVQGRLQGATRELRAVFVAALPAPAP